MDLRHLFEIFEENTYLENFENKIVIDVGSSNADSAIYFATKGAAKIYSLEPMIESYDLGRYNIQINQLEDKIFLINAALSANTGNIEIAISSQNPNANSIKPTESVLKLGINFDKKRVVESISIGDFLIQNSITQVDILKMDCEGCEYEVFKNIEDSTISEINNIILEYHDGIKFLADTLIKKGFGLKYDNQDGLGILKASRL